MFGNEEYSVEELFANATGLNNSRPEIALLSKEAYDGCFDAVAADAQSAENMLNFMDTFAMVNNKNASDKIKMLKKINANYGGKSSAMTASIESFCNTQSMEADAAAAVTGGDAEKAADKPVNEAAAKKKIGFFKSIFAAIGKMFKAVWKFITGLVQKFTDAVKRLVSKNKEKNAEAPAETKDVELAEVKNPTNDTAKESESDSLLVFDYRNLSTSKAEGWISKLITVYNRIVSFDQDADNALRKSEGFAQAYDAVCVKTASSIDKTISDLLSMPGLDKPSMGNLKNASVQTGKEFNSNKQGSIQMRKTIAKAYAKAMTLGNTRDDIYKACEFFFGVKASKNHSHNENETGLTADVLTNLTKFQNTALTKLNGPEKALESLVDKYASKLNENQAKEGAYTERMLHADTMAAYIKVACNAMKLIGQLFSKINNAAIREYNAQTARMEKAKQYNNAYSQKDIDKRNKAFANSQKW